MLKKGDMLKKEDYAKVDPVDPTLFNIHSRLVSDWIPGSKVGWTLKIFNPVNNKYKVIDKLVDDKFKAAGATGLNFRVHLSLNRGPKLDIKLGVVPETKIESKVGYNSNNYPMIQISKTARTTILPTEPENAHYGLGLLPFLIYTGPGEAPIPKVEDIRIALASLFNSACKAKFHLKFQTWKDSAAQGRWEEVEPALSWPCPNTTEEQEYQGDYSLLLIK